MSRFGYPLFKAALLLTQPQRYRSLLHSAKTPREVQAELLQKILSDNADTEFGKKHEFARISSEEEFRAAVPPQTYEDLRPLIERQELTGERCLTSEQPVYYHRTSGTVGEPKNIPLTKTGLRKLKDGQRLSAYIWSRRSSLIKGKSVAIVGQAVEGRMAGGTPYGSASGLIYQSQSRFVRSRYVLPVELPDIEDYETRYLATCIYCLREPNVSVMVAANPSTFLRLLSVIKLNLDQILDSIATGRMPDAFDGNLPLRLQARPKRAKQLSERVNADGELDYGDIWPKLQGLITWTGGSCGFSLGRLSGLLPKTTRIIEWGYASSEFRGTISLDTPTNMCLPTLQNTYFEFVPRREWESGNGEFLRLDELEGGEDYYIFATTEDGLYRYDMNDILRAGGKVYETPTLEFVQKGKGVTNITGEKLTEDQVLDVVSRTLFARSIFPRFIMMIADEEAAAYTLYVESDEGSHEASIADEVDRNLCRVNIEYESKRKSGRLTPLSICWLKSGTGEEYRSACVSAGQRDAQFKFLHLQYARECSFDLAGAVLAHG